MIRLNDILRSQKSIKEDRLKYAFYELADVTTNFLNRYGLKDIDLNSLCFSTDADQVLVSIVQMINILLESKTKKRVSPCLEFCFDRENMSTYFLQEYWKSEFSRINLSKLEYSCLAAKYYQGNGKFQVEFFLDEFANNNFTRTFLSKYDPQYQEEVSKTNKKKYRYVVDPSGKRTRSYISNQLSEADILRAKVIYIWKFVFPWLLDLIQLYSIISIKVQTV